MHVLIDAGHGGMVNKVYVTPGKRSPKWNDLPQLFEGIQNREIAEILKSKLKAANIPFTDVVNSQDDVSLVTRVARANDCFKTVKDAVYVSIHADAAGNGNIDYPATGISVWTSPGQTKSDELAQVVFESLRKNIGNVTKYRTDTRDGDADEEAHFYVLKKTMMPAILCELGFMTNRKECELMQSSDWKNKCAQSIFEGIKRYYKVL